MIRWYEALPARFRAAVLSLVLLGLNTGITLLFSRLGVTNPPQLEWKDEVNKLRSELTTLQTQAAQAQAAQAAQK